MPHTLPPSSFYQFDDDAREVRFLRHDTPTPWMNYLTNGVFSTMISQAGGALAWHRSPQIWRINRYRFFHLPTDRSGVYLYLQDAATGEYWCPTYEPAQTRPERWQSAHGLGYTRFQAERGGLAATLTYFVGAEANALVCHLRLENHTHVPKSINLFAFVEFGMMEFQRELQWQCYNKHQVAVSYLADAAALVYRYGVEMQPKPAETPLVYFAADHPLAGYDGDRDEFVGSYRSESNPWALENGGCTNSTLAGGDPCGALQISVELEPAAAQEVNIFLGTALTLEDVRADLGRVRQPGFAAASQESLRRGWEANLGRFTCQVPDPAVQRMVNTWNPYQAQRNFQYSRNISYYATGTFRGVGFRDTCQDVLAHIPFDPAAAQAKIVELLGQQYQDGHVNHYYFPVEGWPPVTSVHSDDHLWPIWAVYNLLMETGAADFLHQSVPFYDGGAATVYEHLRRAVAFTRTQLGARGLPLMLRSDWNDALFRVCRQGKGESFWTAMQLGVVLPQLAELAQLAGCPEHAAEYLAFRADQQERVNRLGWDGAWFRRAIMDDGDYLGTKAHNQAQIWLNAQSWAVISGMAEGERGRQAMDSVARWLDSDIGIAKVHPPITTFPRPDDPLTNYNPGTGENGAVFCHANTWAIIAECLLGRGERAFKYYRQLIPSVAMDKVGVWRYKAEPYVYASNLFGPQSDKPGLANVSWLTGTAAWMYVAATQYILGIRPEWNGLRVAPCLPPGWDSVTVTRQFRGATYTILLRQTGQPQIRVDGLPHPGNLLPVFGDGADHPIEIQM